MSIESTLSRELNISFLDARRLAADARVGLGIEGYSSKDQEEDILAESMALFYQSSSEKRRSLRASKTTLENHKISSNSISNRGERSCGLGGGNHVSGSFSDDGQSFDHVSGSFSDDGQSFGGEDVSPFSSPNETRRKRPSKRMSAIFGRKNKQ